METYIFQLALFIALELFESNWQKSTTLYGLLKNNYIVYKKNIFIYFLLNSTFIYTIYLIFFYTSLHTSFTFIFWIGSIFIIKFLDIIFKLFLLNKIDKNEDITQIIPIDIELNVFMRHLNVIIYPIMLVFALNI